MANEVAKTENKELLEKEKRILEIAQNIVANPKYYAYMTDGYPQTVEINENINEISVYWPKTIAWVLYERYADFFVNVQKGTKIGEIKTKQTTIPILATHTGRYYIPFDLESMNHYNKYSSEYKDLKKRWIHDLHMDEIDIVDYHDINSATVKNFDDTFDRFEGDNYYAYIYLKTNRQKKQIHTITIGYIEFDEDNKFYHENQREIDLLVTELKKEAERKRIAEEKQKKEAEKERQEILEKQRKDEEERILAKKISEQTTSLDAVENILVMLDMAIQKKEVINITTLQGIENALLVLVNQKNDIKNQKQVKLLKAHFENAHKEYKKYPELSNTVEQRMLKILDMFYEILGKSEEQRKLIFAEMKKTDQEKRISARISKAMAALDVVMVQFQTALSNGETSNIAKLQEIEKIIAILLKYKENIKDKKSVEKHKDNFVAMLNDCKNNAEFSSSLETRMLKILDMFYEILGKSEEQRKSIFAEMKKTDQEKKISAKITEAMTALDGAMVQFQTALSNGETLNIAKLQEIAGSLEVLLSLKDKFSSVLAIERYKTNFEVTFEECMKRDDFSQATETRMLQILDMFYNILGYSYDQKKQISAARAFSKMVNAQDKLMNKISETIRTLQISIEQRILPDISSLQVIEGALSALKNYKDDFQDLTSLVQSKKYFSAMYKDCVKLGCLTSTKTRMKEISKSFDELLNKKSSVWEKVFRR